jgi:glucokinase
MNIGVDIGGTKCAVVCGDRGGIVRKIRFETTSKDETIQNIISAIRTLGGGDAIGISCGGPLDANKGLILSPPNLIGWDNVPIVEMLQTEFGVPAYLCNDADACALAEWQYGAGKGTENMIFLTFGTGMGAGLILGGRLYRGACGMAGEIGHVRIAPFGPTGYGKIGSFEGFCSGGGIAQLGKTLALEKLQRGETLPYCKSKNELDGITAKLLAEHARAGDETALETYRLCAEKLGAGLSILVDILNPEVIVIGSIFARAEDLLRETMEGVLKREALHHALGQCRILPAALGEAIGDYAALAVSYGV